MKRAAAVLFCLLASALPARARPSENALTAAAATQGRPRVRLDALDLSTSPLAASREPLLRQVLAREARRADWGAPSGARVEFRFRVDEIREELDRGVLRVHCSATGFLPKGKTARSHLSFGGAPEDREKLVDEVLSIVARGVVTRLADLERRRRARGRK